MELALMMIGYSLCIVGGLWFLLAAFQQSVLWGLGCLCLPLVDLMFLLLHWRDANRPFLVSLAGSAFLVLAATLTT